MRTRLRESSRFRAGFGDRAPQRARTSSFSAFVLSRPIPSKKQSLRWGSCESDADTVGGNTLQDASRRALSSTALSDLLIFRDSAPGTFERREAHAFHS